jgi:hypothetical protein
MSGYGPTPVNPTLPCLLRRASVASRPRAAIDSKRAHRRPQTDRG